MGRLTTVGVLGVALLAGGGAGVALAERFDDDEQRTVVVRSPAAGAEPQRLVVDDGVPAAEARTAAVRGAAHAGGRALSVDLDHGRHEVEVQRPDGAIVEVLLDGTRVVGIDAGEGDDVADD